MSELSGTFLKKYHRSQVTQLERRVLRVDVESTLAQAKALAFLLTNVAECPNQIRAEEIGWAGSLLGDTLQRLELAIEREGGGCRMSHDASETDRAVAASDHCLAALAILDLYIDAVPDERGEDRYVLWAVREKIEAAREDLRA